MSQAENLAPQVISRLLQEIRQLQKSPPDGVQYVENEENTVSEIHAILSGPEGTPFFGGKFRLKLIMSHDYPNTPPRGFFLTKIYHPNVATNGDICVNTLKKDWTADTTLKHVLQVIRCLLIVPFPESSLNDEAGKLFMDSYDEFARRARIMTEVHALSDDDATDDGDYKIPSSDSSSIKSTRVDRISPKLVDKEVEDDVGSSKSEMEVLGISTKIKHENISVAASAQKKVQDAKKKSLKRL